MRFESTNLHHALAVLGLTATVAVGSAGVASADPPYQLPAPNYYQPAPTPLPAPAVYPPAGVSYYPAGPVANAPLAPLVYTQKYSFYSNPKVTFYPPSFPSPVLSVPGNNVYFETNILAPYTHTSGYQSYYKSNALTPLLFGNTSPATTAPYYTPKFFRY